MSNKNCPFISTIILLGILSLTAPTFAQNPTHTQRDALIAEIQERAQQDVKLEKVPENAQGINLLFGDEAKSVGLTLREVVKVYEEAYQAAKPKKSAFEKFMENQLAVWGGLAIILFILHLLREALHEAMNKLVFHVATSTTNWLYRRLAGYRFLRKIALRRYRQALINKFRHFKIPFRPDRPLNMREIYVPLKVKGTRDIDQVDASQAITEHKRLMVLGAPGAGKSMLLRHIALSYAEGRLIDLPKQPVPILLELNRLNESDAPIEDKLVEILDLHYFPNAHNFVEMALKSGTVMLLFDGLDEVNTQERQRVVNKINDLLDKYSHCRAVITCRVAVYHKEFTEKTEQTLEIVDFNDQQILAFLAPWQKDMPGSKSIEQLINTLRELPRIMALARNPLLLTIIGYLYTDTPFILPHSRAEFYSKATDVLLDQWKVERNHYKSAHKKLVLQHLALFNQDTAKERKQDPRSIDLKTVLAKIKEVLPDLNLSDEDATPLLDEIIERSGLLLSIDNGTQYQFAHLTWQEFFAATALQDKAEQLLTRFKADQDTWRETVKIWCGIEHDSTELIRAIYAIYPIIAFECLADAQKVNSSLADNIVALFKQHLGKKDQIGEAINRGVAAIASDIRPRGQDIFNYLSDTVANAEKSELRIAAANTLSLTNLPKAAEVLANCYTTRTNEVLPALEKMGDLAVPVLTELAKKGYLDVLDALQALGTSQAEITVILVPLLWDKDNTLASNVALRLAVWLSQPNVEDQLREYPLTKEQRKATGFEWVWEPFNQYEPIGSSLPVIAGRIAYSIDKMTETEVVEVTEVEVISNLEPRIVIPLAVQFQHKWEWTLACVVEKTQQPKTEFIKLESILEKKDTDKPTLNDWKNIFRQREYKFVGIWHFLTIALLVVFVVLVMLFVFANTTTDIIYGVWGTLKTLELYVDALNIATSPKLEDKVLKTAILFVVAVLITLVFLFIMLPVFRLLLNVRRFILLLIKFCISIIFAYFLLISIYSLIQTYLSFSSIGIGIVIALIIILLLIIGRRKEREARNPLHGLLEPPKTNANDTSTLKLWVLGWFRK